MVERMRIQGRELGEGDLALIWTLATEPSEWGRTRLSAKVVTEPEVIGARDGREST